MERKSGLVWNLFKVVCPILTIFILQPLSVLASGGESSGGITVIPDGSTLIQVLNFIFLIWALNLILYRPIRKILKQRKEKIDGLEQRIETYKKDAQEKDDAYISGLKSARADGLAEKEQLLLEAAEEERKIIAEINERAQAELAQVKEKMAKDADDTKATLMKEIDDFASSIGAKILGRAV